MTTQEAPTASPYRGLIPPDKARDPDYNPGLAVSIPLGIQHVLAMFVSNIAPAIIVAGAAGFGFGSADTSDLIYLIQMAMFFAGVATLLQTIGVGSIGARLPIVHGTSFAFLPIMIPVAQEQGSGAMAVLMTAGLIGGLFQYLLSFFVKRIRYALPPLVTGLVVLMIALSLMPVGVQYAAGGVEAIGTSGFGNGQSWLLAGVVVVTTLGLSFFGRGVWATAAVLVGLLVGYLVAALFGKVSFGAVADVGWVMMPQPLHFGVAVSASVILGFCLMTLVSAIETIGAVSGICVSGAGRVASDRELVGATKADGIGTAVAALFGAFPNTSFSQNVGLIAITGVMSRHVVTVGAVFLIVCGLVPKIGAVVTTIPIEVLGGGVIVMFGMIASAALSILSKVEWNQRNMLIFAFSLSISFGLQQVPDALQHLPDTARLLLASGVLPAAALAIVLNLIVPGRPEPDD